MPEFHEFLSSTFSKTLWVIDNEVKSAETAQDYNMPFKNQY